MPSVRHRQLTEQAGGIMSENATPERRIGITGAAGYIGSRVLTELGRRHPDWNIVAIDNFYNGVVESVGDVVVRDVDIRDREALEDALDGCDAVLHLAAISGVDDCTQQPDLAYEVNVLGTSHVAWFCKKTDTPLAFPYSMAVVGDPTTFPITVDMPRAPLNWYGRTKVLGEELISRMAADSFPAHLFMISNLYGSHRVDGERISKPTVINFFVNKAKSGQSLTVYEPGTQSRNFVHVKDVAAAFCDSLKTLVSQSNPDTRSLEVATDEDPSVMEMAKLVQRVAREQGDEAVGIDLVTNPREAETLVQEFGVDTSRTQEVLGWAPAHDIESTVLEQFD